MRAGREWLGLALGNGGLARWRLPGVAGWGEAWRGRLGDLGLWFLVLQAATGFWLLAHYSAEAGGASASVQAVDHQVWGGWWVRRLHGAGGMLLVALGLARVAAAARGLGGQGGRGAWAGAVTAMGLAVAGQGSGLVLPWSGPAQGVLLRLWGESGAGGLGGGPGLALALHLVVPLGLLTLLGLERRRQGPGVGAGEPWWPTRAALWGQWAGAGMAVWLGLALVGANELLLPDRPAGAGDAGPWPLPWHLWAPAAMARVLPGGWGLGLTFLLGLGLLARPWWDAQAGRPLRERPLAVKAVGGLTAAWLLLSLAGWWGGRP